MVWHREPYTNFHDMNEDYIASKLEQLDKSVESASESAHDASQSASNALISASQSLQSATDASISASNAEQSANNAQSSVEEINDIAEELVVTNARIDNIIMDSQSTVGNTELIDIRVGYTGKQYESAGSAVRGQAEDLSNRLDMLASDNAKNLLDDGLTSSNTIRGITFTHNDDNTWTITGTATATAIKTLYGSINEMVEELGIGKRYYVKNNSTSGKARLSIQGYANGSLVWNLPFTEDGVADLPNDTVDGIRIVIAISSGVTINETIKVEVLTAPTNEDLANDLDVVNDTIEKLLTLSPINKDALQANDDLNTYLTAGQWRIPSQAVVRTLVNKPLDYTGTGVLIVANTHNDNHVYQVLATNYSTNVWIRHIRIDEQVYDDWRSILGGAEKSYFTWETSDFLVHSPQEEFTDMISTVKEYLDKDITDTNAWGTHPNNYRNISSFDIYAMWDKLQTEYPDYIGAGEIIGYSLNPDGSNYAPVKAYYIHPRLKYGNNINIEYEDMPTIYITAGTHGVEASPTWNLFAIFRRAFLTGTIYSHFLKGMKFRVIPCLSRWSYDHFKRYLAAAYDSNGTQIVPDSDLPLYDPNRQCIVTNVSNPTYASLNIPSYATEAKALTDYLENHNFSYNRGDCFIDLHNCSYSLGYLTTDNSNIAHKYNVMVDDLAKDWLVNSPWKNGDVADYYSTSTTNHFVLGGKILANNSIVNSFAWFFEHAYNPYSSNVLEVQQYDEQACERWAIAKGLDMTYRWLKEIIESINTI